MNLVLKTVLLVMLIWQSILQADCRNSRFYPDHAKIQFAGNQGFLSAGPGWQFFKGRFECDIMYGYMPEHFSGCEIHSITIKRSAILLNMHPRNRWELQAVLDLSTIYSKTHNTYLVWPGYYPSGYYLPNAIHHQLCFGLRVDYNSPDNPLSHKISLYAEAGILDDHLRHHLKTGRGEIVEDINLAFGVRFSLKDGLNALNTETGRD